MIAEIDLLDGVVDKQWIVSQPVQHDGEELGAGLSLVLLESGCDEE